MLLESGRMKSEKEVVRSAGMLPASRQPAAAACAHLSAAEAASLISVCAPPHTLHTALPPRVSDDADLCEVRRIRSEQLVNMQRTLA